MVLSPEKMISERQMGAARVFADAEMFVMPVLVVATGILLGSLLKKYL
jgi:hypothetical protein